MIRLNGTITSFMGTAYTGNGIVHNYAELLGRASKAVLLKAPPTGALSGLLREIGVHYLKSGYDIELFHDPLTPDGVDAVWVPKPGFLFVQASRPVALEPAHIGGPHRVVTFYDSYDEDRLRLQNGFIRETAEKGEQALAKMLASMDKAKKLHDEMEKANQRRMSWELADALAGSLKEELFGNISLNKPASVSNRYIGTLTAGGARDHFPNVTKGLDRRLLIKAHPGTGKSTIMRMLGKEAEARGFDLLYGWCALDPGSIDLLVIPELSLCLFDATEPHVYNPEREGDRIIDMVGMCREDAAAEKESAESEERYRGHIQDARAWMGTYAETVHAVRARMDSAIDPEKWAVNVARVKDQL
ncbi:hypothetical protein [Edaphobacillus lindanitolerans]|uniref:Nucleotide kinase n=1 Tax=Edaphobacillus lindanitolerans TaxID=550447 RepID=A0A1U7PJX6_9BACI|nr:hypothetical protein [Edaphobacillus lindanitolerans]SIT70189.1 hypothetical protein SAMN05428946_0579 [Edaphobacillus lindanitolerans]